jgi:16S rRNA (uracil1498-N3)-methyltransferase
MLFRLYRQESLAELKIDGEDFDYLFRVLRLRENDRFEIVGGSSQIKVYTINKVGKDFLDAVLVENYEENNEPQLKITVAQALPKTEKLEYILQKCTELGAQDFILFEAENSPVRISNLDNKLKRWTKIIESAVCQSRRNRRPTITVYHNLIDFLKINKLRIFFAEPGEAQTLSTIEQCEDSVFVIGPEAGFSKNELTLLNSHGQAVSLGGRILRTETAAIAVCAKLLL